MNVYIFVDNVIFIIFNTDEYKCSNKAIETYKYFKTRFYYAYSYNLRLV